MCFSANASFIAGTALTVAGIVSVSQVRKPSHILFSLIPLFFGIQQFCEGFLWLSLSGSGHSVWSMPAKYVFLIFAQVIWPFWIPLSFLLIEEREKRKKILRYFLFGGISVSLLLIWRLIFYTAVAQIEGCHIEYDIASPPMIKTATAIFYLGAIVVAPFFSSWKMAKLLAAVNLLSLIVTQIFFEIWFVSVWCFFAAVQSVIIVLVMREMRRKAHRLPKDSEITSRRS